MRLFFPKVLFPLLVGLALCLGPVRLRAAAFNLYYLTDTHISPGALAYGQPALSATITAQAGPNDVIVQTGDNVEVGVASYWANFTSAFNLFNACPAANHLYSLGNHECVWSGTGGKQLFDAALGAGKRHGFVDIQGWRIITLDDVIPFHHEGRLDQLELDWLSARLTEAQASGERVVVTNHYFPYDPDPNFKYQSIQNDCQTYSLLASFSCVKLVLSGHEHAAGSPSPGLAPSFFKFNNIMNINQGDGRKGWYGVYTFNGPSVTFSHQNPFAGGPGPGGTLFDAGGNMVYPVCAACTYSCATPAAFTPTVLAGTATVTQLRSSRSAGTGGFYRRPLVVGNTVYVGDRAGHAQALDKVSGTQNWEAWLSGEIVSTPIAVGNDVIWATDRGMIYRTGSQPWTVSLNQGVSAEPRLIGGKLAVPTAQGAVKFLDAATGVVLGQYVNASGQGIGAMAVDNGTDLYFSDAGGVDAFRVNAAGGQVWKVSPADSIYLRPDPASPLPVGNVVVFTNRLTTAVIALNKSDGSQAWSAPLVDEWFQPVSYAGQAIVGDANGGIHSLDPANGSENWTLSLESGQPLGGAVVDGSMGYFTTVFTGDLYAVNLAMHSVTLKVNLSSRFNNGLLVAPPCVDGGVLYQCGMGGDLYRVYCPSTFQSPTVTDTLTPYAGTPTFTPTISPTFTISPTPSLTPTMLTGCVLPFNLGEALVENGTWSSTNSTYTIATVATAPAGAVTQGSGCVRADVNAPSSGWFDEVVKLKSFTPTDWSTVSQLKADIYVTAGILVGATYNHLELRADCASVCSLWEKEITFDSPTLVVGPQTVTWNIDFTAGTIPPGSPIDQLYMILNRSTSSGALTGQIYIDNIRFVSNCYATATNSPTPAAFSATPTRTATSAFSSTPSITISASPSRTPSPSASATLSATSTGTASATPSPTRSATASSSPSATASGSPSATRTASPSATPSASPSATPSATPSLTATDSFTASPTFTDTDTPPPPGSTLTDTPTPPPSATESPTASPSATQTVSGTASPSPSATMTPSETASVTPSQTRSFSPTATPSESPLATASRSATPANSGTPTPALPSATVTLTGTQLATPTWTQTPILVAPTPSDSPTPSPTATPSGAPAPSVTHDVTAGQGYGGRNAILSAWPIPNPGATSLALQLDGPVDGVELQVFTRGMVLACQSRSGPLAGGWNRLPLPVEAQGLPRGVYFYRLLSHRQASICLHPVVGTLVLLP